MDPIRSRGPICPCALHSFMNRLASFVLLAAGVILMLCSLSAFASIGSGFSRFFTGCPTDKSLGLLLGGVAVLIVGTFGRRLRRGHNA